MSLRFGTDGVRGPADELRSDLVEALGRAAARVLGSKSFVIGRDTRESGPRICEALAEGIAAEGAQVELLGVVPTPAVAWISQRSGAAGAMISASHNPYGDNGIKFFSPGGLKLSDETEELLEAELDAELEALQVPDVRDGPEAHDVAAPPVDDAADVVGERRPSGLLDEEAVPGVVGDDLAAWEQALIDSVDGRRLDGMGIVIDCANGSASDMAPRVLRRLGAEVEVLHADPDGRNINAGCGSTDMGDLQRAVVGSGARIGLAFDGDADRVLAVDETGAVVDGDHLIALCAIDMHERGVLARDAVVVTVMSNLGFRLAMTERGIEVVETGVGDRYVLEALEQGGYVLGGEQSGHVIFRDRATTGDGLLTGIQVADLVARHGEPFSVLARRAMTRLPQSLHNVRIPRRGMDVEDLIGEEIARVEAELGGRGRVLVRPSGTEPLVRVMVEAEDPVAAEDAAARLVSAVEQAIAN